MDAFWRRLFGSKAAPADKPEVGKPQDVVPARDAAAPPVAKTIYRRLMELDEPNAADFDLGGLSPEHEYNQQGISFMPGALDGITMRRMAPATPEELQSFKTAFEPLFRKSLATLDDTNMLVEALSELQEFLARQPMARFVDFAIRTVVELRPPKHAVALVCKALVIGTFDREVAKFGLAALMIAPDDDAMHLLRLFGRLEEFAPYVIGGISSCADDPIAEVWVLARSLTGWGRVHAVTFLSGQSENRPELSQWLLCEGWRANLTESLPFDCAVGGQLRNTLLRMPDEEELDGCCGLLAALVGDDAIPAIDELPYAAECIERLLHHLRGRCDSLDRGCAVLDVHEWLSRQADQGPVRLFANGRLQDLIRESQALLASAPVPTLVDETVAFRRENDIWKASRLAHWSKFDWWASGFAWLRSQPDCDALIAELVQTDDKGRGEGLLKFLEASGALKVPEDFAKSDLPTSFDLAISQYLDLLCRCDIRNDLVQSLAARSGWLPNRRKLAEWILEVRLDELGPRTIAALRRNANEETNVSLRALFKSLVAKVDALTN